MNGKKLMFNPKLNILVGLLLTATVTIAEETDEPITELARLKLVIYQISSMSLFEARPALPVRLCIKA
jgi:hypothetical protein